MSSRPLYSRPHHLKGRAGGNPQLERLKNLDAGGRGEANPCRDRRFERRSERRHRGLPAWVRFGNDNGARGFLGWTECSGAAGLAIFLAPERSDPDRGLLLGLITVLDGRGPAPCPPPGPGRVWQLRILRRCNASTTADSASESSSGVLRRLRFVLAAATTSWQTAVSPVLVTARK